jgi:hypothetical protein
MSETITNNHKASGGSTVVRVTRRLEKNCPNFGNRSQNNCAKSKKGQIIFIKAKNIDIIPPSKLLKYLQQTIFPPKKLPGPSKSSPI